MMRAWDGMLRFRGRSHRSITVVRQRGPLSYDAPVVMCGLLSVICIVVNSSWLRVLDISEAIKEVVGLVGDIFTLSERHSRNMLRRGLLAVFLLTGLVRGAPPNVVDVGYASYLGNQTYPNAVAYLGVPYAEPPLSTLRWRAPLPLNTTRITASAHGGVINATEYPEFCIQGSTGDGDAGGAGSEDCLKVNIYAPTGAKKGANFPVLVYFHGGGYVYGNPRNWPFDHWVHQSPDVIIVSVYYRLDAFGFLAVEDFSDSENGDFNVGFQDQIQALKWVQKYIYAFGGNPEEVTINGQSAGGSSVELHMTANQDRTLFFRAIAQSVYRTPVPTVQEQKPLFDFFATAAGCGTGPTTVQLSCLRNATVSALARAQDNASYGSFDGLYRSFHPVLDRKLITQHPTKALLNGQFQHVPLIVGSTSNESLSGGNDIETALKEFFPSLSNASLSQYLEVYPASDFDSDDQRFQVATGESELICARALMGAASTRQSQTFTYRYNQPNPTSSTPTVVSHAAENWMMFLGSNTGFNGTVTFSPMTPTETAFAEELIAYWLSFVRSGNPNAHKLPRSPIWSPYTSSSKVRIVLQQGPGNSTTVSGSYLEAEPTKEHARCQFVASKVSEEED